MLYFTILFNHNKLDTADIHLKILFNNSTYILTILIGTYVFFLSQYTNILLYNYFKQIKIKSLWIIHPLSRLISGYLANFLVSISINTILKFYPENKKYRTYKRLSNYYINNNCNRYHFLPIYKFLEKNKRSLRINKILNKLIIFNNLSIIF